MCIAAVASRQPRTDATASAVHVRATACCGREFRADVTEHRGSTIGYKPSRTALTRCPPKFTGMNCCTLSMPPAGLAPSAVGGPSAAAAAAAAALAAASCRRQCAAATPAAAAHPDGSSRGRVQSANPAQSMRRESASLSQYALRADARQGGWRLRLHIELAAARQFVLAPRPRTRTPRNQFATVCGRDLQLRAACDFDPEHPCKLHCPMPEGRVCVERLHVCHPGCPRAATPE